MTDTAKQVLVPGPDHSITIERTGAHVVVRASGRLIASTTDALTLSEGTYAPVQYVPLADVDQQLLRRSTKQTYCPYKGDCSYFSIVTPEAELVDAVWTYEQPYPAVGEIAGHVAFYANRAEVIVAR